MFCRMRAAVPVGGCRVYANDCEGWGERRRFRSMRDRDGKRMKMKKWMLTIRTT